MSLLPLFRRGGEKHTSGEAQGCRDNFDACMESAINPDEKYVCRREKSRCLRKAKR